MSRQRSSRNRSGGSSRSRSRRRSWKNYIAPILVVIAAVGAGLFYVTNPESDRAPAKRAAEAAEAAAVVAATAKPAERTAALPPLNLPADDAPHGSGMEWWYYNGILDSQTGQRYAFHVAVFVANTLVKHTVMHMALTDLQTGRRYASQTRTAGVPAPGAVAAGFDFRQEGWEVRGAGPSHALSAAFDGVSFALNLVDAKPPIAHRAAESETPGLLDFGKSGISYYYSRPRIATTGEISIGGKPVKVSGDVWFDHQWGDFDVLSFGWNWFALHLSDGSDVMLYDLFDADGKSVLTAGTVSNAKGEATALRAEDIELTPLGRWTSPATSVNYNVEWRVKLPSGELNVKPFFPNGEFDSSRTTANIYWEGPVKVSGAAEGEGFLELSGYERLRAPR